jgi:hypothetical protein
MNSELIPCACGKCNIQIHSLNRDGKPVTFAKGHHLSLYPHLTGRYSARWKGGRKIVAGYWQVKCREHHFTNANNYVAEHRLVWEEYNKAVLLPWGVVHHINHDKLDNRIENLEAMTFKKHCSITSINNHKKFKIMWVPR